MKYKIINAIALAFTATAALANPPQKLITHNTTNVESNAYIAGTVPSRYPAKPFSDSKVNWPEVKIACVGHIIDGKCDALVKMETDTDHPVDIGYVSLDVNTGDITPKQISANGYTLTVNGPGESTLSRTATVG